MFFDDRGRDDALGRRSLRTEQADFQHSALQLVVTYKKIGKPASSTQYSVLSDGDFHPAVGAHFQAH